MYSNIDLDHAIKIMQLWLETYVPSASESILPTQAILDALELVMRHNIMQFGDSYFLQLIGTAMGTSVAVVFANLYFGWHEKELILPRYQNHFKRILYHARLIDDVFFIWIGKTDSIWKNLIQDYNSFGILKWEINEPSSQVDFLDLTLTISKGKITTKTFQKANNPYLYIPPHSAHTPGMIHGIIFSLLKTYYHQNSEYSDFMKLTNLLFKRHIKQGWDQAVIKNVFKSALTKLFKINHEPIPPAYCQTPKANPQERLFFHMEFHPQDIPREHVRRIYQETCGDVLKDEIGIERLTMAYSRPRTIGNIVAKAKLLEAEGKEVSKYITGELD
jgi:hypothetical protein